MNNLRRYWRSALRIGLVYGVGLLGGHLLSNYLFTLVPAERFFKENQALALLEGVLLAFVITGIGGLIGGTLGGWFLPSVTGTKRIRGYALQSGVTFGVGYGLLIFPVILVISLLTFYDVNYISPLAFGIIFGVLGAIFGLLMGLVLGLWTLGRTGAPVAWGEVAGFGLGGVFMGLCLRRFLLSMTDGTVASGGGFWLALGLFIFAFLGGAGLGVAYRVVDARRGQTRDPIRGRTFAGWRKRLTIVGAVLLGIAILIRPVIAAVGDLMTPVDATISRQLDLGTIGTHWLDPTTFTGSSHESDLAIASGAERSLVLAWATEGEPVQVAFGSWDADNQQTTWQAPLRVAHPAGAMQAQPDVALDQAGRAHLVWTEGTGSADQSVLKYSTCDSVQCNEPTTISPPADLACASQSSGSQQPTVAIGADQQVLVVWENVAGPLLYALWATEAEPGDAVMGCVAGESAKQGMQPQLASGADSDFVLAYVGPDEGVYRSQFVNDEWAADATLLGSGQSPVIVVDVNDQPHLAWCNESGVAYWHGDSTELVSVTPCIGRPQLALDSDGRPHVVWHTDRVENTAGIVVEREVLVESVRSPTDWEAPAIVDTTPTPSSVMAAAGDGSLHLAWSDDTSLSYAAQIQYACDPDDLSSLSRIIYDIEREEQYVSPSDPVPFCRNRYDRLVFTPNPDPAFSDETASTNGGFDVMADLIRGAQHEVLFSTMWYKSAKNHDSPGSVIAAGVADLYASLRANPDAYPRGVTVRILLGNPPELIVGETSGQLWSLLSDLSYAGIDQMVDEEIGWRLEVADYEGNLPHSHVKGVIIDGKTAVSAGFNMSYDHFSTDHPSGQGEGRFDLGVQVTGPAVQAVHRMYDDLWAGADQRHCYYLNLPYGLPWQATCFDWSATADHVPEVQKYYLAGEDDAFSLYRSKVRDSADRQVTEMVRAAEKSIDLIHVNFALEMICSLNLLFDVCTVDVEPGYMSSLLEAASEGAKVRVLVKAPPIEGIENLVAIDAIHDRLSELGLEEHFELRYFDGPLHPKAALVDDELLIIGSQNLHYSAFGTDTGLNEHSIAVESPQAAEDFKRTFDYHWERAQAP